MHSGSTNLNQWRWVCTTGRCFPSLPTFSKPWITHNFLNSIHTKLIGQFFSNNWRNVSETNYCNQLQFMSPGASWGVWIWILLISIRHLNCKSSHLGISIFFVKNGCPQRGAIHQPRYKNSLHQSYVLNPFKLAPIRSYPNIPVD